MTKSQLLLIGFILSTVPVWADHYIETTAMGGGLVKTWMSGDKKRDESSIANMPSMKGMAQMLPPGMGQTIKITRLDKGVEWTLYPAQHTYAERSLELPYTEQKDDQNANAGDSTTGDNPKESKMEIRKVSGQKTFAGYSSDGYEIVVDQKVQQVLWLAPLTGDLKTVYDETQRFNKKLQEIEFSKWPKKDQVDIKAGFDMMKMMGKGFLNTQKIPEGYPMCMEANGSEAAADEEDNAMMKGPMYQVNTVSAKAVSTDMFEIPAGYTRSTEEQMQQQSMQEMMKKFQQQMPQDEGSGTGDNGDTGGQ
jgi:hypothetical protein